MLVGNRQVQYIFLIIHIEDKIMTENLLEQLEDILSPHPKIKNEATMPAVAESKTLSDMLDIPKYNSSGKKDYMLIKKTNRIDMWDIQGWIIIDGVQYKIFSWCNFEALAEGDYKTADHLLYHLGFNTYDFEIKDRRNEVQYV